MDMDVKVHATRAPESMPEGRPVLAAVGPTLEDLYREYFQFVWRNARRLGVVPSQLDDAVQDVFMVVHRHLPEYEARTPLRFWLFAITRRVAADYRRTLRRKGGLEPLPDDVESRRGGDGPLRDALNKERSDVVLQFLSTLEDNHRATFILCELEQMSAPEISEALGATTSAIYARIRTMRLGFAQFVRDRHPELMGESDG